MRNPYRLLQSTHKANCKNSLIFLRNFGTCANNRVTGKAGKPELTTKPLTTSGQFWDIQTIKKVTLLNNLGQRKWE